MSKRIRTSSIEKKLKEGLGQGTGIDYKPWIKIQDVPSLGRSTRLKGIKIPRQHEFLSDLERNYFYLLEYSDLVVDIREQYPLLPIEETIVISDELGIKHPANPKTGKLAEMTTDFLVTININGEIQHLARTLKYKNELMDKRVMEKFEIERVYWKKHDIDWGIVTELEVPKTMAHNIAFVREYFNIFSTEGFEEYTLQDIEEMNIYLIRCLLAGQKTVKQIAKDVERDFGLLVGCGISLFKHLVISKAIEINMKNKIDVNRNITIDAVRKDFYEKVRVI